MFKLKYKIFNDLEDELENNEFYGEFGYFQISVGTNEYGLFIDKDLEAFSVSIYWWMRYFIEATLRLSEESTVYISDIETPQIWIELRKINNGIITIGKVEAEKIDGSPSVESERRLENMTVDWREEVNIVEYKSKIIEICQEYLNDLNHLNVPGNIYIKELENMLKKLQESIVQ